MGKRCLGLKHLKRLYKTYHNIMEQTIKQPSKSTEKCNSKINNKSLFHQDTISYLLTRACHKKLVQG